MAIIISANFYEKISDYLKRHTIECLELHNEKYKIIDVPGIFEIPAALEFYSQNEPNVGYVILGCVIQGETRHYDHITQEVFRSINEITIRKHLALGLGIVTTENYEQAIVRSNSKNPKMNSAVKATTTMLHMMKLFDSSE